MLVLNSTFIKRSLVAVFATISLAAIPLHAELPDNIEDETTYEGEEPEPPPLTPEQEEELAKIEEPEMTESLMESILKKYDYVDPDEMIPKKLLKEALTYYDANLTKIKNRDYVTIINFSTHSRRPRMFIVEIETGDVEAIHVAHGSGSDPDWTGYASQFSNRSGSNMSSLGYYLTAETYSGKHGYSLRLDGLSKTNSRARERAIVIHGAKYVRDQNVKQGRSWGCPAVSMAYRTKVVDMLKGGSLIYAGQSTR